VVEDGATVSIAPDARMKVTRRLDDERVEVDPGPDSTVYPRSGGKPRALLECDLEAVDE
jgi:hypothetical protein